MSEAEYKRRLQNPNYAHTARRWRDHLKAYPDIDQGSIDNCYMLIREYAAKEKAAKADELEAKLAEEAA